MLSLHYVFRSQSLGSEQTPGSLFLTWTSLSLSYPQVLNSDHIHFTKIMQQIEKPQLPGFFKDGSHSLPSVCVRLGAKVSGPSAHLQVTFKESPYQRQRPWDGDSECFTEVQVFTDILGDWEFSVLYPFLLSTGAPHTLCLHHLST